MKKRILLKIILTTVILLAVFLAAAWGFLSYQVSRLDAFKEDITKALSEALEREVTYEKGRASLTLSKGLSIELTGLVIREKDGRADLLNVRTAFFRVDLLPLLVDRVTLGEVFLEEPRLFLKRDKTGALNIADLLSQQKKSAVLKLRKVIIADGSLAFTDQAASDEGLTTELSKVQCRIDASHFSDTSRFRLTAGLQENKSRGTLALDGTFRPPPSGQPIREANWDATVRLAGLDILHYQPYLSALAPSLQPAGRLNLETTLTGSFAQFTAKGNVMVKDARLHYPRAFRKTLRPLVLQMDYRLTRGDDYLKLDVARLVVDRAAVAGHFSVRGLDKEDPILEAAFATSTFSLAAMHSYIPWEIIPTGVGRFIESHITSGDFRLVDGRLNGRLSQIAGVMKPENAGVLSVRAEVKNGIFTFGPKSEAPGFSDISGTLELRNRQFSLRKMAGRFGASPCRLEGGISDFAGPVVYNVQMSVQPARPEVLWLLGKEKFRQLKFDGLSTLLLSGSGPAHDFRISAHWDLTGAAYTYPDIVEKPKAKPNRLAAEIVLEKNAFSISSLTYDLPPITVKAQAAYRFTAKKSLSLSFRSNTIKLSEAASLLPALRPYDPAGSCMVDLTGRGAPDAMIWGGSISFTDVSLQPPGAAKRIAGLTGAASFRDNRMETSQMKARLGESVIGAKCRIQDLREKKIACRFNAPQLQAADLGLSGGEGPITFDRVRGRITFGDNLLHVDRFSLGLGKSSFNFSGDVKDFSGPKITGSLNASYIHSDDVFRLMALKFPKQRDAAASRAELDLGLDLLVDAGAFNDVDFRKLKTSLKWRQGVLNVENLEAQVLGGRVQGSGRMETRAGEPNRFAVRFALDRVSLASVSEAVKFGERMVTGDLSLSGDLAAYGNKMDDLKKTAAGTLRVKAEKGVLKKFSVLSKIFSLLNVSQLLKFHLPDMANDGMPYTTISANLSLKEGGVLSSNDFLIDSEAMKMSGAGSVDLVRKKLDFIVGVHPLQTLDRIAARIPIAGWVLTDEGGNLVTVHFKATGSWDDPDVRPIPVRSLAKGTFDTFRRLFQLPEKLITDTGDVILGR